MPLDSHPVRNAVLLMRTYMQDDCFVIERDLPDAVGVRNILPSLGPFRKGPFLIDGVFIDSHWNSDLKWKVLLPMLEGLLPLLRESRVRLADVGSNNGYYLFRLVDWMLGLDPTWAEGDRLCTAFDPVADFEAQFRFLHGLLPHYPLRFERAGWQSLSEHDAFDIVLCMGVLYHHTDPAEMLRTLRSSLRKGGRLILETMVVPSREDGVPYAIVPSGRYAGAKGIWFVPDVHALLALMRRTGWQKVELASVRSAIDEQKRFGDFPSFREMLDENDITRTIEGLPAPQRAFVIAQK
ncbi:methyltransferase [Leptonema illini DSM 21528]|uniref:Methyltransferase n=2 Tax=Leptonema illini TaxID=183 RepID=H2CIB0_9LEPT|nr:methyltransferase [Leptonema illini DSM 21528]